LPIESLKPDELEFPSILRNDLMNEPSVKEHLLASVDFVLVQQAYRPPPAGVDPLLGAAGTHWYCRTPELNWVRLCRPDRGQPQP
jgi:hypothetical protein